MIKTTDELLESIKLRSMAPTSQTTFTDTRLLTLMSQELRSYVAPKIIGVREDFFLNHQDTPVTANRELYPMVERAVGNSIKAVTYIDSGGNEKPLFRTTIKSIKYFNTPGEPGRFLIFGDNVRILPAPNVSGGFIRQYYFQTLSDLVKTSSVGKITAITEGASTTEFTINKDLTSSLSSGDLIDFQSAKSPFQLWKYDVEIQTISATKVTVNNSDIQDASGEVRARVGDYICPPLQTNIPQVPVDYMTLLVQRVVCKIYESLNDARKLQLARGDLLAMEKDLFTLVKSRVEAQPRKVSNKGVLDYIGRY